MNKRIIIIASVSIAALVLSFIIINQPRLIDNSEITKDGYYVQKGYEKVAKIIKPALENYLNQSKNESLDSRNKRLSEHFTTASPVYNYDLDYMSPFAQKSTGKMTAVYATILEEQPVIYSVARVSIMYKDKETINFSQTFWLDVKKDAGGEYTQINDLGVWE